MTVNQGPLERDGSLIIDPMLGSIVSCYLCGRNISSKTFGLELRKHIFPRMIVVNRAVGQRGASTK